MDVSQITALIGAAASLLCTVVVGALTFFMKKTLASLEEADKRNAEDIKTLDKNLNDLKADLPLIYVTREDYIRVMNRVEDKLDQILYGGKAKGKGSDLMAILDELTEQEVSKNKAIRGYIVRALAKGSQNALLVRQITNALVADGLIYSPDISKPIEYLQEAGYVTFTDRSVNAYNAYRKDSIIKLTRKGVDLVEGTINDPGIDV